MRPFLLAAALLCAGCRLFQPARPTPARSTGDPTHGSPPPSGPVVLRDTALEQRAARLELKLLEQEAQVAELQSRLDDARREVVRAMAKLQSIATRAEAASGMAEAEIALQALRTNNGTAPELGQGTQLLQLAAAEFDKENYGGALYLATEAKNVAGAAQGRDAGDDRAQPRSGEVAFALPLHVQTTGRANVREGPGGNFKVLFTLEAGAPLTAYSYVDQWVRVRDDNDRPGWIHETLVGRRP